jgi:hypothetical protein
MTQENFYKSIVYLLAVFVLAFIILGFRFVENGRYIQYDQQKDHAVFGDSMINNAPKLIDTRTGKTLIIKK